MYNLFLSINNKFFMLTARELGNIIDKYNTKNYVCGFEFCVRNKEEQEYLLDFAKRIDSKYIINLHSISFDKLSDWFKYINYAVKLSKVRCKKINIVYHPICDETKEKSIEKTIIELNKIIQYINQNNYGEYVEISVENLNILHGKTRLLKEDIEKIIKENNSLKFTYDIGHETVDGIKSTKIDKILKNRLNNIHIHSYNKETREDHYPIIDIKDEKILKKLLSKYGKDIPVVMEYAIDYIEGDCLSSKVKNYIKLAERINN